MGKGLESVTFDTDTGDAVSWRSSGFASSTLIFEWLIFGVYSKGADSNVLEGFRSQLRYFAAATQKPGALELVCKVFQLGVDVEHVDRLQ